MYIIKRNFIRFAVKKILFSFIALVVLVSCASMNTTQKSNLTPGVVKTKIQKGVTSQAEILRLIGSPNIITKNKEDDEVWNYSRQSFDAESGGFGGGLIFLGGAKAFSSSASKTFDLIITFDKNNVVKDYSVVSSQF